MTFIQWIASNWQAVCGWSTAMYLVYRIGRFFTSLVLTIKSVVERFEKAEATISTVATNHLPHIQWELEKTNQTMSSMDETLKKMYAKQHNEDYA